ncbi:phage terminase small subunit [Priestia koreensis]|uniref:phage terminase small subunit n=1 Tax=Priestia koreensis TaxID=284581 RepID=UPI0030164DF1
MPRQRDPRRDEAFEIWKQHKGEITNRAIADQLDVDEKKVAVWKQRDKWNVVQQINESCTKKRKTGKSADKKEKRSGNPNPKQQFTERNSAATKHGLFSKYLHREQIEIMDMLRDLDISNQIWLHIEIKSSAIIRMQKIMWVEDANDHLKEESGNSWGEGGGGESFKVAFAYERYESYIKAQSRAMAEYRNLVKQFLELAHFDDERRLKLEQIDVNIQKAKAELNKVKDTAEDKPFEIIIKRKEMHLN